jgi:hypothetical protein
MDLKSEFKVYEFVSATAVVSVYYTDRATIDFNSKIRADEEKMKGFRVEIYGSE